MTKDRKQNVLLINIIKKCVYNKVIIIIVYYFTSRSDGFDHRHYTRYMLLFFLKSTL